MLSTSSQEVPWITTTLFLVNLLSTLGRNLQAARLSAGLTQQELADRVGVDLAILAQIEAGAEIPA